jgi:transcriptional regulator with XRE-family HTH domain
VLDNQRVVIDPSLLQAMTLKECETLKQDGFAEAIHTTHPTINRWCNLKVASISFRMIRELANYFDISTDEMMSRLGGVHSTDAQYIKPTPNKKTVETFENITWIPVYDIMASAGNGVMNYPVICQTGFDADEIASKFGNNHKLEGVKVRGDSMHPTVDDGDIVYINRDDTTPKNGIFVIRIGDEVLIKRLSKLPNKSIRVSSDNEVYPPFEIDLNGENLDFEIIGKVWKKMQDVD